MELSSFVNTKDDLVMIVQGNSHYFSLKGHFEYVDLASEFQFLVIKAMQKVKICSVGDLSDIFGLTEAIALNVLSRLQYHGLVKKDNKEYSLTKEGEKINDHTIIVEKDIVDLDCEICVTSNTYLGLVYDISIDNKSYVDNNGTIMLSELQNKPENLVRIDDRISIADEFRTWTFRSQNSPWKVISESGNEAMIQGLNLALSNYDSLFTFMKDRVSWINNSKMEYNNLHTKFKISKRRATVSVTTLTNLRNMVIQGESEMCLVFLEHRDDPNIRFGRKIKLRGDDALSIKLLLLGRLLGYPISLWYQEKEKIAKEIQDLWTIYGGEIEKVPTLGELIDLAFENKEFYLVNLMRIRGDFLD